MQETQVFCKHFELNYGALVNISQFRGRIEQRRIVSAFVIS